MVLDTHLTPELRREGLAREIVRRIQSARKAAGYNIEDRIEVRYTADGELAVAIAHWKGRIQRETLATSLEPTRRGAGPGWFRSEVDVEGKALQIYLARPGADMAEAGS